MYTDLLLALSHTPADGTALATARALAGASGARLAVPVALETPLPPASEWGGFPSELYARLCEETATSARAIAASLKAELSGLPQADVRVADVNVGRASAAVVLHARHADLSILGLSADPVQAPACELLFIDLLMGSGRPVLVVPEGTQAQMPPKRIAIAWQPTREATRALHDALPLLRRAELVQVLVVDPEVSDRGHGAEPGADIAAHLARHGVRAEVVAAPRMGQVIGDVILRHAGQAGADLIVCGGYGHGRMREQVLGGVTRSLLSNRRVPVLFSH